MRACPSVADHLLSIIGEGAWIWDLERGDVSHNATFERIVGCFNGAADPRRGHLDRVDGADRARCVAALEAALADSGTFDLTYRLRRPDGRTVVVHDRGGVVDRDAAGRPRVVAGSLRDVSDDVAAHEALARSQANFASLAANVPGAIFRYTVRPDGRDEIEYMSPGCFAIWEYAAAELERDPTPLWDMVLPEDAAAMRASVRRSAETLEQWSHRWRIRTPSGRLKWLDGRGVPTREADGTTSWHSLILDVSEQVRLEEQLRESQAQLLQAQRMEAIGNLTGGMAHDFNNLLAVILGNLEMMEEWVRDGEARELLDAAITASERGADLTRKLLSFARRAELRPEPLAPGAVVRDMARVLRRTIPETIIIEHEGETEPWTVAADRASLESAILNLAINARDAMPAGGRLTLRTASVEVASDAASASMAGLPPGRYVALAVADTGCGMSAAQLDQAFEPFFTTKAAGSGSGLGLAMVQGFMRQSGGQIHAESVPGRGTVMTLYFPAAEGVRTMAEDAVVVPAPADTPRERGHALLVEDEAAVRAVIRRFLEREGFEVTAAADGDHAVEVLGAGAAFDLVLSDIVMPGSVQGVDLARHVKERHPELPVVLLSGYPDTAAVAGEGGADATLTKPVRHERLRAVIAGLLHGGRRG